MVMAATATTDDDVDDVRHRSQALQQRKAWLLGNPTNEFCLVTSRGSLSLPLAAFGSLRRAFGRLRLEERQVCPPPGGGEGEAIASVPL